MKLPKQWSAVLPCSHMPSPTNFTLTTLWQSTWFICRGKLSFFHALYVKRKQMIISSLLTFLVNKTHLPEDLGLLKCHRTIYDDSCLLKKQGMKHLRNVCVLPGAQWDKCLPFEIRCTESSVGTAEINCAFGGFILTWMACICLIIWIYLPFSAEQ